MAHLGHSHVAPTLNGFTVAIALFDLIYYGTLVAVLSTKRNYRPISLIPAMMTFAVIPFAAPIETNGHTLQFQIADLNVGVLYILSIASLGVYGIIVGGWASNNKYALLGSMRSSSQMISYELSMGFVPRRGHHGFLDRAPR